MAKLSLKLLIITTFTLSGCSSSFKRPESIQAKMSRYQSKLAKTNVVPDIPYQKSTWNQFAGTYSSTQGTSTGRAPASIPQSSQTRLNYSSRKLYFFTLWSQYKMMTKITQLENAPKLKSCPKFHSSFIDKSWKSQNLMVEKRTQNINWGEASKNYQSLFPEVSLPITTEYTHPKVKDSEIIKKDPKQYKETVKKAFNIHLAKLFSELEQLCESGNSDNYYAFQNLLQHTQNEPFKLKPNELAFIMKTSIFTNHFLLTSIGQYGSIERNSKYNLLLSEIYERLGSDWPRGYFSKLKTEQMRVLSSWK
ncbi:MAG: hypothetical protein ACPGJV_05055 [Bacteriovoracaceae bacterium]